MIDGVELTVGAEAVTVTAGEALTVVSSAVVGGGFTPARSIVNLHVPKDCPWQIADRALADFIRRRGLAAPVVGLLTSAWTELAEVATESNDGLTALVAVTVGLGNVVSSGRSTAEAAMPGTINTIVIVDAVADPAALVNVVITVTEVKTLALAAAGVQCRGGEPATGTSTDAVVVAATGRGRQCRFGGPISTMGWTVARAARTALETGVERWQERHR
jgi:iron complex transport system ATP-binding protein